MFLGKHLNERSFFMDKESISRLGLDYISNIDVESSDEIYDPSTTNHIIVLKLIKQSNGCLYFIKRYRALNNGQSMLIKC